MTDAELLAKSTDLLDRLRAAQLDPQTLRHGWLAEAADEIATIRRKLALAQEECRTARAMVDLFNTPLGDPTLEREVYFPRYCAVKEALNAARAANQMDAQMAKAWTIGTDTSLSISRKDTP